MPSHLCNVVTLRLSVYVFSLLKEAQMALQSGNREPPCITFLPISISILFSTLSIDFRNSPESIRRNKVEARKFGALLSPSFSINYLGFLKICHIQTPPRSV